MYRTLLFLLGVCLKILWAALVIPMYLDLSAVVIGAVRKLIHRKTKETRDGDAKVGQSRLSVLEEHKRRLVCRVSLPCRQSRAFTETEEC